MVLKTIMASGSLSATLRVSGGLASARGWLGGIANGDRLALGGRRRVGLDEVEQAIEGDVGQAAGKEHGEDAVFANGLVEGGARSGKQLT